MIIKKLKKLTKLILLGAYSLALALVLVGVAASEVFAEEPATENVKPLSKEEFAATLASKLQLLKVRTVQLKAMNACFHQASGTALEAKKKGETFTKGKAMELVKSYGLDEAAKIDKPLSDLKNNAQMKERIQQILAFAEKREDKKIESEFNRLEKEILADLKTAKDMGIDVAAYKEDMSDYAKSRFEHLMWNAIFTGQKSPKKPTKKK